MPTETKPAKIPARILLIFSLLAIGILTAGYLYYEKEKTHYLNSEKDNLAAITDLKISQITTWRKERLADVQIIMENRIISNRIKEFLDNRTRDDIRKELTEWMISVNNAYDYSGVFLLDINGDIILSSDNSPVQINGHFGKMALEAIRSKRIIFSDFHKLENSNDNYLDFVVPIFAVNSRPVGSIVLIIEPGEFLYPFIQTWPVPSRTAETLLIRREGSEVVFLNELRHRKNTALSLRIPLSKKDVPAVMAVRGAKGVYEGVDYRGIPVMASVAPIPDSPWFIVAKKDKDEIYEPLLQSAIFVSIAIVALIFISGMGIILWWREQHMAYYRSQLQAAEELNRYTAELQRSNEELQQFAYIASHDLQEPLRMISSYLQLIERRYKGKLDNDADEFIAFAVEGATRLQTMITGLLAYSRVQSKGSVFEELKSSEVLDKAVSNLQVAIEESGALITSGPLPVIKADAWQLLQVYQNLIANAIKFRSKETPHIHVSAEKKGEEWVCSVRDNGIGIAPEYNDRIFNLFQRLHGREYPGVGIGLSLCRRIVERHGGRIWFESEAGKGTVFYFTIPIKEG